MSLFYADDDMFHNNGEIFTLANLEELYDGDAVMIPDGQYRLKGKFYKVEDGVMAVAFAEPDHNQLTLFDFGLTIKGE